MNTLIIGSVISLGKVKGLDLEITFQPEDQSMYDHFVVECGMSSDDFKDISHYEFFSSEITAKFKGHTLATVYLGCSCYENLQQVIGSNSDELLGGYGPQMIEECIEEALCTFK